MKQIASVWRTLDMRRRIVLVLASGAVFLAVLAIGRMATAPSMTLLYAGLETGAAGDVVRALEQRGAVYDVRGGSIFVDARMRDELRMTLASDGLPANGARGYELLDNLNGFGTTSQMFDAAYWRAKEGELARTIVANPAVTAARVHIANVNSSPFVRSAQPTASVSLTTTGGSITAGQAKAFQHLVASAVAGLKVDDVTVIDSNGMLLGANDTVDAPAPGMDLASQLKERVSRLVEARVGNGNAVVEVSVETVTESESIRERRFDPDSRVAISTEVEERANASTDQPESVTVASNLPDGDAATGESTTETTETRERINYEVSETERELIRAPGAIKRLSVAVLVNGVTNVNDAGETTYNDRSEAELDTLRDLVASAVGFDEARGDIITIHSMELPTVSPLGTSVDAPFLSGMHIDAMSLIQMFVLAAVVLVLALFVLKPLLSRPPETNSGPIAIPDFAGEAGGAENALIGELELDSPASDLPALPDTEWQNFAAQGADPVDRLRNMIADRQEETVEILRTWLENKEETV